MDGRLNPRIGPAAAEDLVHGLINFSFTGVGVFPEQGRGLHHLTRLAIAALGYLFLDPGPFYRVVFREAFNGGDGLALGLPDRQQYKIFQPGR